MIFVRQQQQKQWRTQNGLYSIQTQHTNTNNRLLNNGKEWLGEFGADHIDEAHGATGPPTLQLRGGPHMKPQVEPVIVRSRRHSQSLYKYIYIYTICNINSHKHCFVRLLYIENECNKPYRLERAERISKIVSMHTFARWCASGQPELKSKLV